MQITQSYYRQYLDVQCSVPLIILIGKKRNYMSLNISWAEKGENVVNKKEKEKEMKKVGEREKERERERETSV